MADFFRNWSDFCNGNRQTCSLKRSFWSLNPPFIYTPQHKPCKGYVTKQGTCYESWNCEEDPGIGEREGARGNKDVCLTLLSS